ncbi:MAG: hypothetical protein DCF16_14780 [Alphaproteobacteria bacterium]|nr:MAG: hypothetical protein DCF16_14780 [Alphaproteobacteria bacterium]
MSDLLSDLWKNIEKSWQEGATAPSLGPSVGRGLFSNPFLSEHDRDVRDVRTLYGRVRLAYDQSIFADEDRLESTLLAIFKDACRETGVEDHRRAVSIVYTPLSTLLRDEFLSFPDIADDDFTRLTLRDMSELRSLLFRKAAQLRRADETHDLACRAVRLLLSRILEATGEGPPSGAEGALELDASALDALHDQSEHIEFAWRLFFAKELVDGGLFADLRTQLERNALTACRVDPNDPKAWTSKVYLPTNAKGRTPRELVSDYLGETPLAGLFDAEVPISIPDEVRFEHTHIIGGSGHGKSQLLLHLIHHDLTREEGPGLIVIDSQGDLFRTLSRLELFAPGSALASRLILIDPSDVEYPVALSLFDVQKERLAGYGPAERERLLNGAVEMYEYVFSSLLGAELTQKQGVIFRFLARLMMVIPGATLHTFLDLMEHGERFREHMRLLDGTARRFFDEEFFHPSFAATKKQIAKRLWGILANPVFERLFSQPKGKLDLFEAMQTRKIILISTAKDVLRQEGSEILGRFFLAKITQAVMERATLPLAERAPAFIYIDEAQEYVDEHMGFLLNQARKYRVGLTLAHQNLDQLPPALRASVMSSTSLKLAGGVSAKDARALADDMQCDVDFLQNMRKRRGKTQFACHVRNRTPGAVAVSIPLGAVNALPQLSDEAFEELISNNRAEYCTPMEFVRTPDVPPSVEISRPEISPASEAPNLPREQPVPRATDPYLSGRGGRDHKYLQHLLRAAAHERGFKADIELAIEGGSVDVAIEGRGRRIACEISITTDAEHEAGNVVKCLAVGFDVAWLIVTTARRKSALTKSLGRHLGGGASLPFIIMTPEEAITALDALVANQSEAPKGVRGYAVSVRHSNLGEDEARRRRETIASVLAKSLKGG